jgi:hypothetical protein
METGNNCTEISLSELTVALMKKELMETGINSLDELLAVGVIPMPVTIPEGKKSKDLHTEVEGCCQNILAEIGVWSYVWQKRCFEC